MTYKVRMDRYRNKIAEIKDNIGLLEKILNKGKSIKEKIKSVLEIKK